MPKLQITYVWEVPVRVTHWVNFLSIYVLAATGIYIGAPRTLALETTSFVMGWVRFVHFVFAYIFAISVISRIYWLFVGNRYSSWRIFFPYLNREGRRNMLETFRFYTFLRRESPHVTGHNALAGATYFVVFLLYLIQIFTGFAIYSEYAPYSIMNTLFGWMYVLFNNQGMRLTHNLVMWLLIAFSIHHVYSAWLMDIKERNGIMSSMFGGYKTIPGGD